MAYIDREVAIKTAMTNAKINNQFDAVILAEAMEDIPIADVAEVKHGYWIEVEQIGKNNRRIKYTTKKCPVCGYCNGRRKTNYCPDCGAKMDGKKDA